MYICPSGCPSYEGLSIERGRPVGECDECGEYIYEDGEYYENGRIFLCEDCARDCL